MKQLAVDPWTLSLGRKPGSPVAGRRGAAVAVLLVACLLGAVRGWRDAQAAEPSSSSHANGHAPAASIAPAAPPATWLPALGPSVEGFDCEGWLHVTHRGAAPARPLLALWTADGPGCAPSNLRCGPLLAAGAAWHLRIDALPFGVESGMVLALEIAPDDPSALPGTDASCGTLRALVDDCVAWSAWRSALGAPAEGSEGDAPRQARAGVPPAAIVHRVCSHDRSSEHSSAYAGLTSTELGAPLGEEGAERWRYHADLGPLDARWSWNAIHIQNAGDGPARIILESIAADGCGPAARCEAFDLAPGQMRQPDLGGCEGLIDTRALRIQADAPLAIVVESALGEAGPVLEASPAWPDGASPDGAVDGTHRLVAPLAYDPAHGFDQRVVARNHGAVESVAHLVLRDVSGRRVLERHVTLCPGGHGEVLIPADDVRSNVRLASLQLRSDQPLSADLVVDRPTLPGRLAVLERQRYALSPPRVAPWSLPIFARDLWDTGVSSELTLLSEAPTAGHSDVVIALLDQNAIVGNLCRRLAPGRPVLVNADRLGMPDGGFIGSALVSSVAWTHPTPPALFVGVTLRKGTRIGADIPGDEVAAFGATRLEAAPDHLHRAAALCVPDAQPDAVRVIPPAEDAQPAALSARHLLPALGYQGKDEVCVPQVTVRNTSTAAQRFVFLGWGDDEAVGCQPEGGALVHYACSPIVAPGAEWSAMGEGESLEWPRSGMVLVLDAARTVGEAGGEGDAPLADRLCYWLQDHTAAGRGMRPLLDAWDAGGPLPGIGLRLADAAGGAAEVEVTRRCPHDAVPGREVEVGYRAHDAATLGQGRSGMRHAQSGGWVYADAANRNAILEIQNAGTRCTSVTVELQARGDCLNRRRCRLDDLAPGATASLDVNDCVGPDWIGTVRVSSTEPLAVVAAIIGGDATRDTPLWPGHTPLDHDGSGFVDAEDVAMVLAAVGTREGDPGWNARLDVGPDGQIDIHDANATADHICGDHRPWTPPLVAGVDARRLFVPALNCDAHVQVTNMADEALVPIWLGLAATSRTGACDAPVVAECGPLLPPGGLFHLALPADSNQDAAIVLGLRDVPLAELGLPSDERRAADVVCAAASTLPGDCTSWERLLESSEGLGSWAGLPVEQALGGPLAAAVERTCPSAPDDPATARAQYLAVPRAGTPLRDGVAEPHRYALPMLFNDAAGFDTWLHVQNTGAGPARPVVRIAAREDCINDVEAVLEAPDGGPLPPGASTLLRLDSVLGPDFQGSATIESDQPLAIVQSIVGRDTLMDITGLPATVDGESSASGTRWSAWLPDPARNWDIGVAVHNLSPHGAARVRVRLLDEHGGVRSVFDDWVCAEGGQLFFLPLEIVRPSAGPGAGRVLVDSLPTSDGHPASPIAAILSVFHYNGAARGTTTGSGMVQLYPRTPGGASETGDAAWFVPGIAGSTAPTERQHIAVANTAEGDGTVDVVVRAWDGTTVVTERCLRLDAGASSLVDLTAGLPRGFRGAALVSAVAWSADLAHPSLSVAAIRLGPPRTVPGTGRDSLVHSEALPATTMHRWADALSDACPSGPEPTTAPTSRPEVATATTAPSATPSPPTTPHVPDEGRLWLPWVRVSR